MLSQSFGDTILIFPEKFVNVFASQLLQKCHQMQFPNTSMLGKVIKNEFKISMKK